MDGQRFDDLTKSLMDATSRRRVLTGLAGAVAGAVAAALGPAGSDAAPRLNVNARCDGRAAQCPPRTRCSGRPRRCRCVPGTEPVGGRCVAECTGGRVRDESGACVCPTACTGGRVPDATCQCVCPATAPDICPVSGVDACVDLRTDENNCGACGVDDPEAVCPPTATCVHDAERNRTECVCPGEQEVCPTAGGAQECVDPLTDRNNCGGCAGDDGVACAAGETCVDGLCE